MFKFNSRNTRIRCRLFKINNKDSRVMISFCLGVDECHDTDLKQYLPAQS